MDVNNTGIAKLEDFEEATDCLPETHLGIKTEVLKEDIYKYGMRDDDHPGFVRKSFEFLTGSDNAIEEGLVPFSIFDSGAKEPHHYVDKGSEANVAMPN